MFISYLYESHTAFFKISPLTRSLSFPVGVLVSHLKKKVNKTSYIQKGRKHHHGSVQGSYPPVLQFLGGTGGRANCQEWGWQRMTGDVPSLESEQRAESLS